MPHLTLQTGTSNEEKDCPGLRCMIDTGASLSTANFHYMEVVVRQYPQILKSTCVVSGSKSGTVLCTFGYIYKG